MKDLTLRDIAELVRKDLLEQGVNIPRRRLEYMLMDHFNLIDKVMSGKNKNDQFFFSNGDVTKIYRHYDELRNPVSETFDGRPSMAAVKKMKSKKQRVPKAFKLHRIVYSVQGEARRNKRLYQ